MAGLAAALELTRSGERPKVTLLEAADRVGGMVRVSDVGGIPVDEGAESLLARRTEAVDLARQVGLGDQLVAPATTSAGIWSRGRVHHLPSGTLLGVPTRVRSVLGAGVLSPAERVQALAGLLHAPAVPDQDEPVGDWVRRSLGPGVADRLVEPLLGGVYAGQVDELSLRSTMPALAAQLAPGRTVRAVGKRSQATGSLRRGPVFQAPVGGVGRLPLATAAELVRRGVSVRTGAEVRLVVRADRGWRVVFGPARESHALMCDAVVVALPAPQAAALLYPHAPVAATELSGIAYAGVGLVTLVLDARDGSWAPHGSGVLVPAVERRVVKAVTLSSRKWGWYADVAPGALVLRASVGRYREDDVLDLDDDALVAAVRDDLRDVVRVGGEPRAVRVTRWRQALPQYAVGHVERVARIRADVAKVPGLAVCGAAYDGVGIPAVIASGREAAHGVLRPPAAAEGGH
ncbi:oxygen-dependent protoporphyrinogen oxidase [Motilibacter rhizosphaerae]|uniref:Coproporphyrinogen III oxidase n=2 Tax=Motilibacter rhizosphaerae TaxID=598652 RepID=A0A4Q7NRG7_9ACTN|nr:oxygen-dependent protoporphyrinogen oxidase [Motilibacter rhizosphaerae]